MDVSRRAYVVFWGVRSAGDGVIDTGYAGPKQKRAVLRVRAVVYVESNRQMY